MRLPRRRRAIRGTRLRRRRIRRAPGAIAVKPLLASTLAFLRALPDQRWLDRLVRSRWWIPVLGVMLTAIVGMQVEVLKSGVGTGRSINLATRLESRYQLLSASVAELDSPQRIEQVASQMGMVMAGPTSIQFVHASTSGSVRAALSSIRSPDSQSFMSALAAADGTSTTAGASVSAQGGASDSAAGAPVDSAAGAPVDSAAGAPVDSAAGAPVDSATGGAGAPSGATASTAAPPSTAATTASGGAAPSAVG
jgi:hypothetical protein